MTKYFQYIPHLLIGLGVFFLGVFFGLIYQINSDEIKLCPAAVIEKEKISSVEILEVSPFGIKGKVYGNTLRIAGGEDVLEIEKDREFQFNTAKIFRNIKVVIPNESLFFASSRGKTSYPIEDTKQLEKIRHENLVFFKNQQEAVNAGYKISD